MARKIAKSDTNPHIREKNSPLETLALQALRRFGDYNPGTVDGDVMLMFLEFANMIIDDIRMHPYHDNTDLEYYESIQDVRPIDDIILVQGLLYHYAMQQGSDKIQVYLPTYNSTLNRQLWHKINGNTKIRMTVVDDGTNKANAGGGTTNTNNGTVTY